MGWKGESRRHSLARKGIKTAKGCPSKAKGNESWRGKDISDLPPLEDFMIMTDVEGTSWEDAETVFFISTLEDRSVGIFGFAVSPAFKDFEDLKNWWRAYGEKIQDIYWNDELTGDEVYNKIQKIIKDWEEYKRVHEWGQEYARTGDPRTFRKDSRLESLKSKGNKRYAYETIEIHRFEDEEDAIERFLKANPQIKSYEFTSPTYREGEKKLIDITFIEENGDD